MSGEMYFYLSILFPGIPGLILGIAPIVGIILYNIAYTKKNIDRVVDELVQENKVELANEIKLIISDFKYGVPSNATSGSAKIKIFQKRWDKFRKAKDLNSDFLKSFQKKMRAIRIVELCATYCGLAIGTVMVLAATYALVRCGIEVLG